jgi:uncharacterized protein (TIGR02391 family)
MDVEIVSDKILKIAQQGDFNSDSIAVRNWLEFSESAVSPDILILDLDLSEHTNDNGVVPTFLSNIQELRECFRGLRENIIPFLESGRVVIALTADRTGLMDFSNVDSLSWLDRLQSINLVQNENKNGVETVSDLEPVMRYFDCVELYDIGIRVEDGIVTDADILARNPVNREPVAIAADEYLDPNGIPRQMKGKVVLLPQPTDLNVGISEFVFSLVNIGNSYLETGETESIDSEQGQLRLPSEIFDEELIARCSQQFNQENYQSAVQNAFIALEERIREQGGFSYDINGVELVTEAFKPDGGPLSFGEINSEQQGIMQQYRSAFMAFRNPSSHRFLEDLDKVQTYHLLCYANMLIQMIKENTESQVDNESE